MTRPSYDAIATRKAQKSGLKMVKVIESIIRYT